MTVDQKQIEQKDLLESNFQQLQRQFPGNQHNVLINIKALNLDADFSLELMLFEWAQQHIKEKRFSFIKTEEIYNLYARDITNKYRKECVILDVLFYKKIETVLQSTNLYFIKSRNKQKRGYTGVKYIELPD